jgi:hypothetical protein
MSFADSKGASNSGDWMANGPAQLLPWELREAEKICPSTFWGLI